MLKYPETSFVVSRKSLVTRLEHAAYLGGKLEEAEIVLRIDKERVQDNPLFKTLFDF